MRDLANWLVALLEKGADGTFNAVGPDVGMTMREFLETIAAAVAPEAAFTWVDEEFLLAHDVEPWTQVPLWLPANMAALSRASLARARASGLSLRSLTDTARDTIEWNRSTEFAGPTGNYANVGLDREQEQALLAAWHVRSHKSRGREEK